MISDSTRTLLNAQIMAEFFSSNFYLELAANLYFMGYPGFCEYMKKQAEEERAHGMKIYDFLLCQNASVFIVAIAEVESENFKTPDKVFARVYEHEKDVTESINLCMKEAIANNDYAVISFLQWFVDEQVQEEKESYRLAEKTKMLGEDVSGLFALEAELLK